MRLYLVRHGEAKSEAEDPNRSLTEQGSTNVRQVAEAVKKLGIRPAQILHSGKLRAQQTAELFSVALNPPQGTCVASSMAPHDPVQPWRERLDQQQDDVMLVGHLPHLDLLASLLLSQNEQAGIIRFRTGTVVCLERAGTHLSVQWVLTPEMSQ